MIAAVIDRLILLGSKSPGLSLFLGFIVAAACSLTNKSLRSSSVKRSRS